MRVAGLPAMAGGFLLSESRLELYFPIQRKRAMDEAHGRLRLEVFIVADGHTGWGFDGLRGDKFCGVALEFVDAVDESGAVDSFCGVGEWGGGSPLLEEIVYMRAGNGAGLTGGRWIDR